jgi:thiaminase/transcriptional activator TenA
VVATLTNSPVADFCAALRELQVSSGIRRSTLARQVNYGRSQLYDILDGRIRRPPEWDRLVEPLVRTCLRDRPDLERTVADWRTRHEALLRAYDQLTRRGSRPPERTTSRALLRHSARLWPRLIGHPFAHAAAAGTLSDDTFRRWLVNDHYFNVEYQRFIAGVAGIAPTDLITELIAATLPGTRLGLTQIRALSARFGVDLDAEPGPATVGLAAYLHAQVSRGYDLALAALYAAEQVYFDTWSAVRPRSDRSTPYWVLIDAWSCRDYEMRLTDLGRLMDAVAPSPELFRMFDRTVRLELRFLDGLQTGAGW